MATLKKKKIVCMGGGNAMPKAVLSGLKHYLVELPFVRCLIPEVQPADCVVNTA